ncbi:MAG: hypothetical protein AB8B57_17300 [Congregibacter sp.]
MNLVSLLPVRYRASVEPLRSVRRIELVLLLLLILVVLQVLWWGFAALREERVTPVAPARDSLRVLGTNSSGSISASQSLQLQSRPLFWGSRRPTAPVEANEVLNEQTADGKPSRRLENFQLTGLFGAGARGGAIVAHKGERTRLSVGDEIDGWTLLSVSAEEAVFVSAGVRDARRLLPLPVVSITPPASEVDDLPSSAPAVRAAGIAAQNAPAAPSNIDNTQKPASLSLGGK